jgi:hypothetical protein
MGRKMIQDTRREILRKVTAGGIGLTVMGGAGTGVVGASGDKCFKEFECEEGTYVKFEFVIERDDDGNIIDCYFEEETDTGLIEITDYENKDGEECEPISVEWTTSDGYVATEGLAFGGDDCDEIEVPENGSYTSELVNNSGNQAAISNLQFCVEEVERLDCPEGTRPVARYDVERGDRLVFTGGEDVVEFSNKTTTGDDELTGFDFASIDGEDDNDEPETLTTVTVEYGSTVETFEVDPDFEEDKRSGSVSVDEPICRVLFCEAVYAQADFSKGDVIEDLCEDQQGEDKISSITWSSYNGQLNGIQGQFDGTWDIGTETVTVNYDPDDYDQKVSLAVYEVDDPTFKDNTNIDFGETRCRQTLVDSDTDEVADQDGTLSAYFPSLE